MHDELHQRHSGAAAQPTKTYRSRCCFRASSRLAPSTCATRRAPAFARHRWNRRLTTRSQNDAAADASRLAPASTAHTRARATNFQRWNAARVAVRWRNSASAEARRSVNESDTRARDWVRACARCTRSHVPNAPRTRRETAMRCQACTSSRAAAARRARACPCAAQRRNPCDSASLE